MKKLLSVVLTLLLMAQILPLGAFELSAAAATSGYYTYSVSGGEATIIDVDKPISGDVTIPSTLGGYPVTSIGEWTFSDCTGLTSVTIPNSVTSIGASAFYMCNSLTSIDIPDSVTSIGEWAFSWCSGLTSITIPDSVTSIGKYAFEYCSSLTSITIPDSVIIIGNSAFRGCSSLKCITLPFVGANAAGASSTHFGYIFGASSYSGNDEYVPSSLKEVVITDKCTSIRSYAFYNCSSLTSITIPDGVTSIGKYAFEYCSSLTSITIPDSVTSIGYEAFFGCTSLENVYISDIAAWCNIGFGEYYANPLYYANKLYLNGSLVTDLVIPEGVTSIGSSKFYNCSSLTSITIPDSVTSIGSYAFYDCSGLTSITIPDGVTSIGTCAFAYCDSLTSITIPEKEEIYFGVSPFKGTAFYNDEKNWENGVFYIGKYLMDANITISGPCVVVKEGVIAIADNAFNCCYDIESIVLPDSVKRIGASAFCESGLKSVIGGSGVTKIGQDAFRDSFLEDITLPDDLTEIEDGVFYSCDFRSINIPDGVRSIGVYAFEWCKNLESITIPNSVTSIDPTAFNYCAGLESITVDNGNTNYEAKGNCLIEKSTKTLIRGCKNSIIPDDGSVTSIGGYAFSNCGDLESITIPYSVISIGDCAFLCCDLKNITISDSVTEICNDAFLCCPLENVFYMGTESQKSGIHIGGYNTDLINATWYYNSCIGKADHTYDSTCDEDCNICGEIRADIHEYDNACDKNCNICGETRATEHEYDNACDKNCNICGETRITEHTYDNSYDAICNVCGYERVVNKNTVSAPAKPVVQTVTANSVTLEKKSGYEYSMDGRTWQISNVFNGLTPNTEYSFCQRTAETETDYASPASSFINVTTIKNSVEAPGAPKAIEITRTSIKLAPYTGYEYSLDGINWQKSNLFSELNPNTKYIFYQRIGETEKTFASEASAAIEVSTLNKYPNTLTPAPPIVAEVTTNKVVLVAREGYEYSRDGISWQTSNVFSGLSANTSYTFYQRIAATTEWTASGESVGVTAKTVKTVSGSCAIDTSSYFNTLRSYINNYGEENSDGYMSVEFEYNTSGQNNILYLTNNSSTTIKFLLHSEMGDATNICRTTFYLTKSPTTLEFDNWINVFKISGFNVITDTISNTVSIDCTKHTPQSTYTLSKGGNYYSSSTVSTLFSDHLQLLCTMADLYIYYACDFGLAELGFVSYSGGSSGAAHGETEVRNAYAATCTTNGYTGDIYCKNCGQKVSSGSVINCTGSHNYTNSCDSSCNKCGEERRVDHSYSGACDPTCDLCGEERETVDHTYDSEHCSAICNECGFERVPPHIFDDYRDLICNHCGAERPPHTSADHIYDNLVDPDCNICGEIREITYTGWIADGSKWIYYKNGVLVKNQWLQDAGKWYFLDADGYMLTNCWKKDSVGWCYLGVDGAMVTNAWVKDTIGWCFVGENGYCVTNTWKRDSIGWCYLNKEGSQVKNNWVNDGGKWYFIDAEGYMVSSKWMKDSKGWCWLTSSGAMATNAWVLDGGKWYHIGSDGYMQANCWIVSSGKWCYLGTDGAMKTNAWVKDGQGWCYVGADGYCVTNTWKEDSVGWCYLDANGRMVTNSWMKDSQGWCYLNANGYMSYGWVQSNGAWYYLDADGYMVTGYQEIDGAIYYFYGSGKMLANESLGSGTVGSSGKITADLFKYYAGSDYRTEKRAYKNTYARGGGIHLFINSEGHLCVITHILYNISGYGNYTIDTLHNLSTGTTIVDPVNYYSELSDRYFGNSAIYYLNKAIEAQDALIELNSKGVYLDSAYFKTQNP